MCFSLMKFKKQCQICSSLHKSENEQNFQEGKTSLEQINMCKQNNYVLWQHLCAIETDNLQWHNSNSRFSPLQQLIEFLQFVLKGHK